MRTDSADSIEGLLVDNVPSDLLSAIEDAMHAGARRAYAAAFGMDEGHLPHVVGQLRHFHMNEAFHRALLAASITPTPIRGNGVISGATGLFRLARFNVMDGFWNNCRRSTTRKQMARANRELEPLILPDLFEQYRRPDTAVAFVVSVFSGSLQVKPEAPTSVVLAVPNRDMTGWLFRESLDAFLRRYEVTPQQIDNATPTLKRNVDKKPDTGTGDGV